MWPPELHTTERAGASQRPRRSFCAILQREAGKTGAFAPCTRAGFLLSNNFYNFLQVILDFCQKTVSASVI
nr:MAG TPA: hypothetical protein [Caudoviricetes sp.]